MAQHPVFGFRHLVQDLTAVRLPPPYCGGTTRGRGTGMSMSSMFLRRVVVAAVVALVALVVFAVSGAEELSVATKIYVG